MRRKVIKNRKNNEPTEYYLAGDLITILDVGEFPSLLLTMWEEEDEIRRTFKLCAVTAEFIYYADEEEGDASGNTVMLNRQMELVSDNFLASNDLVGLVENNIELLWISDAVKYW
ncbi:hypothetical protein [Pseudoflavitalea rhizosphaerae]|uniref:hypothetical protein n=1 Tax=Pseudoflavitalea rhizosphaerae TaxID=1884793 RepID=UPI000F8C9F1B|nr:hypothetical protein [Pseudoflavitalea rhizosphaerae]